MRKVGTTPRAIRTEILTITDYHGTMGIYTFDRNGNGLRQNTIVQNVHGHLHVIKVFTF